MKKCINLVLCISVKNEFLSLMCFRRHSQGGWIWVAAASRAWGVTPRPSGVQRLRVPVQAEHVADFMRRAQWQQRRRRFQGRRVGRHSRRTHGNHHDCQRPQELAPNQLCGASGCDCWPHRDVPKDCRLIFISTLWFQLDFDFFTFLFQIKRSLKN